MGQAAVFDVQVGAFALDDHKGDSVDKADQVGAAGFVGALTLDDELLGDVVDVVFRFVPIDKAEGIVARVPLDGLGQGDAQGEDFVDALVGVGESIVEADVGQAADRFGDRRLAEMVLLPFVAEAVVFSEPGFYDIGEHDVALTSVTQGQGLVGSQVFVTQVDQQLGGGDLGDQFFAVRGHLILLFQGGAVNRSAEGERGFPIGCD